MDFVTILHSDALLSRQVTPFEYGITSHFHLARARKLLACPFEELMGASYVYAALEFRSCIERILFEFLIMNHGDKELPKRIEKTYTGKDLKGFILREAPDFYKRMEFITLMLRAAGSGQTVGPIDLDQMCGLYGRLGAYLHCQIRPESTVQLPDWWRNFYLLLRQCELILGRSLGLSNVVAGFHAHDQGQDGPFEKWARGELTDDQIIEMMRIEMASKKRDAEDSAAKQPIDPPTD